MSALHWIFETAGRAAEAPGRRPPEATTDEAQKRGAGAPGESPPLHDLLIADVSRNIYAAWSCHYDAHSGVMLDGGLAAWR